jgi:hypothetical protein
MLTTNILLVCLIALVATLPEDFKKIECHHPAEKVQAAREPDVVIRFEADVIELNET